MPIKKEKTKNKLKNKKQLYKGIWFDSTAECSYFKLLEKEKEAGRVISIQLQPKVVLTPKFEQFGKRYQAITYTPDYLVKYSDGTSEYIDVKGFSTQQGIMRRKLFALYIKDVPLIWVSESKKYSDTGFIDYDELQKIRRENKKKKAK